jgi:hypothetical protein
LLLSKAPCWLPQVGLTLHTGDTFTTPKGATRRFSVGGEGCIAFVVRGNEDPAAPGFLPQKAA